MVNVRLVLSFIFILQVLSGCGGEQKHWPIMHFDQIKWAQTDERSRFVFVRDLIDSKKLNGLTRQQILDLLGKPSYDQENGDYVTYIVKADSSGDYILDIRFKNENARKIVSAVGVRSL